MKGFLVLLVLGKNLCVNMLDFAIAPAFVNWLAMHGTMLLFCNGFCCWLRLVEPKNDGCALSGLFNCNGSFWLLQPPACVSSHLPTD